MLLFSRLCLTFQKYDEGKENKEKNEKINLKLINYFLYGFSNLF